MKIISNLGDLLLLQNRDHGGRCSGVCGILCQFFGYVMEVLERLHFISFVEH